jgi:hypothetical protein
LEESRVATTNELISTIGPARLDVLASDDPSFTVFQETVRGIRSSR